MKNTYLLVGFALTLMSCNLGYSAIVWTNTSGGNWSDASSWNPNQVPGAGDDAAITNGGAYVVTLDAFVTVNSLALGGGSGTQTLAMPGYSLTLNNPSVVNKNGLFAWAGGSINGSLTVATDGALLATGGGYLDLHGVVTNAGTIQLTNEAYFRCYGDLGGGQLINLPGGLVDIRDDSQFSYVGYPTEQVVNQGMVRKSGGTGFSFIYPAFYNSGELDVMSGTAQLIQGEGSGVFKTEAGATLIFNNNYELEGVITGAGTNLLSGGSLSGTNGVISGGTLTWTGGSIASGSTLTIATNGVLLGTGGGFLDLHGALTNAGTILLTNATYFRCDGDSGGGQLINLPGALVNLEDDSHLYIVGYPSEAILNQGTVRKSGGTGTSSIAAAFYNSGALDVQTGEIDISAGEGGGVFKAQTGTTVNFINGYTADSGAVFMGGGTTLISGGAFTLNGAMNSSNLTLTGGYLTGNNAVISSLWTWTSGGVYGTVTVATNGVLLGTGGNYLDLHGALTNAGTILLTNETNFRCYGDTGNGQLINLPGALVDLQDDSHLYYVGYPHEQVVNQGTVRKSGGTGISYIYAAFYNFGALDVMSGTAQLNQGEGSGVFKTEAGATLNFVNNYEMEGVITGAGTNLLSGGSLSGTNGVIRGGALTWTGGVIASGSALTIATNGALLASGGSYLDLHGALTNAGTIQLTNATYLRCYGDSGGGKLINLPGALVDFRDDSQISYISYSSEAVVNQGTVRKSGGTGTSYIYPAFYNSGTLDAQIGTISLPVANYDLTGGRLNFGLNSPTNYGQISLSGNPATLTGALSANLNNGFVAIRGESFGVLNYASQVGNLDSVILPTREAWSTNYGATTFTLTALNSAPTLPTQTNRVMNEETALTVTNTATDLDLPADTLSYTFLAAPSGAHISAAGIITWTPDESQGPGTNTFTTRVADNGSPSLSATNSFTVIVNEVNVAPVLPVIANTNINELATLTVTNTATDHDIPANPLTYVLAQAPTNAVIDTNGVITWTPTEAQGPSTNTFTTVVTDTNVFAVNAKSLTATNTFTVIVNEVNVAPQLTVPADQTINELTLYTNNATATDSDIPANTLTFALVSGPTNMTVSPSGAISWTPSESQGPSTNLVKISVTDFNPWAVNAQHLSATNSFTITVNEVNAAPALGALSDWTVNPGQTISFTATATDSDIPTNTLTFSLVAPPAGASLNSSNGLFSWRPTVAQANTTNTVQVQVIDFNPWAVNSQHLSDTKSFKVAVNPLATVILTPKGYTNGQFEFQVSGAAGPDYIIASSTNLSEWNDLFTNLSPTMPFQFTNAVTFTNRFFRARQSP